MDQQEQYIFLWHAEDYGAIPIYLHVPKRGEREWLNLIDNKPLELYPFTKEWVQERSKIKKMLSDLKNPKKGGSRKKWKKYVIDHYQMVKSFIC